MAQTFHGTLDDMGVNGPTLKQYLYDNWQAIVTQWAGENPPDNPYFGQPWLDISEGWSKALLKMWNGTNWVEASKNSIVNNDVELARGSKNTLWERLEVALNEDGTLKSNLAENMTEWIDSGLTPTYVSTTEFSVEGDQTDVFVENRKIKATLSGSIVYSAISASSYVNTTDITTVTLLDEVLDDGLQKIEYGFVKPGVDGSLPICVPFGGIIMWSGSLDNIPNGWLLCDGTNGTPDLRDRFIVGAGNDYDIGDTGGANTVTLTKSQIPSHTHTTNSAGSHSHSGSTNATGNHSHNITIARHPSSDAHHTVSGGGYGTRVSLNGWISTAGNHSHSLSINSAGSHKHTINSTGGGQAHENRPPYYVLAFIMKS